MYRRRGDRERIVCRCFIRDLYSKSSMFIPHKGMSKGETSTYADGDAELCGKLFVRGGESGGKPYVFCIEFRVNPHLQHLSVQ